MFIILVPEERDGGDSKLTDKQHCPLCNEMHDGTHTVEELEGFLHETVAVSMPGLDFAAVRANITRDDLHWEDFLRHFFRQADESPIEPAMAQFLFTSAVTVAALECFASDHLPPEEAWEWGRELLSTYLAKHLRDHMIGKVADLTGRAIDFEIDPDAVWQSFRRHYKGDRAAIQDIARLLIIDMPTSKQAERAFEAVHEEMAMVVGPRIKAHCSDKQQD